MHDYGAPTLNIVHIDMIYVQCIIYIYICYKHKRIRKKIFLWYARLYNDSFIIMYS